MPLPPDRSSLLRLAAETERALGEIAAADGGNDAQKQAAELLRLAFVRFWLGEMREAERLYDECATAFWNLDSAPDREAAAVAWIMQTCLILADCRYDEALRHMEKLIHQSGGFPEFHRVPSMRSYGLEIWLWLVQEAGDPSQLYSAAGTALALLDPADPNTDSFVITKAMVRRARTAATLGHAEEALELFEMAIARLEAEVAREPEETLAETVARAEAVLYAATRLGRLERDKEEGLPEAHGFLLESMLRAAVLHANLEREQDADAAFERIVARFGERNEPWAQEAVTAAHAWLEADGDEEED
jgi:tetratricopeptide (TPR) repeat protein